MMNMNDLGWRVGWNPPVLENQIIHDKQNVDTKIVDTTHTCSYL